MAAYHTIDIPENSMNSKCKNCIFRVPNVLRRQNPEAYTPNVVSIGPFHHYPEDRKKEEGKGGNREKDFQLIERVKQSYLKEVLEGINDISLEGLIAEVKKLSDQKSEGEFERLARECYAEPLGHIPSKDFAEMMIVDGCFLIQLFRKCNCPNLRASDDPAFNMDYMFHSLCHDILLLENQLPWFVIHSLYNLTHILYPTEGSLSFLIFEAFSTLPSLKQSCSSYKNHLGNKLRFDGHFLHILDLLRSWIVVPLRIIETREHKPAGKPALFGLPSYRIPTATALSNVGIKLQCVKRESILDIRFKSGGRLEKGILEIPQLNIGRSSLIRSYIQEPHCN